VDSIHERKSGSPESLETRAFTGFGRVTKLGQKAALTTGLTTDRKIFDFRPRRGIMAKTEYPGLAQLVARVVWDFIRRSPLDFPTTAETLDTLRKTRFSCSRKIPAKAVHTTCLLLQNKISYSISGCGAVGSAGGLGDRQLRNNHLAKSQYFQCFTGTSACKFSGLMSQ